MKTANGFTAMTVAEFAVWLPAQKVTRGISRIQIHHTAAPNYSTWNKLPNPLQIQKNMRDFHVNSCGWADIAQQFTICPDGTIVTGRSLNKSPAGITGANSGAICIENIGNFDKGGDTMTTAQADAIVAVTALLLKRFGLTPDNITYHAWWTASGGSLGDYVPGRSCKTCPGTAFFGGNTRTAFNVNFKVKVRNYMKGAVDIKLEEYTDIGAIAWELNYRGVVDDKDGLIAEVKTDPDGRLYWLARKLCHAICKLNGKGEMVKVDTYTDIAAIAWDLNHRGIVEDKQGLISDVKAAPNGRLYWLARKGLDYLRRRD